LLAPAMFGQGATQTTQERQFHLTRPASVQAFQEIVNGVRIVTEIRDMSTDNAQMSVTVRGTAEQIGLADWLVKQLDQPAGAPVIPVPPEYKGLTESDGDGRGHPTQNGVARVFYLPHTATVQDFQEAVNATRTVIEIRRMYTYNDGRAVLARGTSDQMAMMEWMLNELDQASAAAPAARSGVREYGSGTNDVLRVDYVANAKTVQDFQEIANLTRTVSEIRRVYTYNTARALAIRCTPTEMAMAQWLVTELDKPADAAQGLMSAEYRNPGAADDVMRVFYLGNAKSVQDFQASANAIRSVTQIRRVFTNNSRRALAVRGTGDQLALAEKLVHDLDPPAK
jgi:hypothetical protein